MKTKREHFKQNHREKGNVLIYVLIAVALFAGLGFTLSRQASNSDTSEIDVAQTELYSTQMIGYMAQVKSVIDQMMITGSDIDELDFTLPSEAGFNTPPHIHKVFHPQGGGLSFLDLKDAWTNDLGSTAGVYAVKKNVEWTPTTATDVIFSFYRLKNSICLNLNDKLNGVLAGYVGATMDEVFTDQANPATLDTAFCGQCENQFTYIVYAGGSQTCTFYSIVADR